MTERATLPAIGSASMPINWTDRGFEHGGQHLIQRGDWTIARLFIDGTLRYALYRGREHYGHFPDAHEAAVHADLVEAGQP